MIELENRLRLLEININFTQNSDYLSFRDEKNIVYLRNKQTV